MSFIFFKSLTFSMKTIFIPFYNYSLVSVISDIEDLKLIFLKEDGTWGNPFDSKQDYLYKLKHKAVIENDVHILYSEDYQKYIDYVDQKYPKHFLDSFRLD